MANCRTVFRWECGRTKGSEDSLWEPVRCFHGRATLASRFSVLLSVFPGAPARAAPVAAGCDALRSGLRVLPRDAARYVPARDSGSPTPVSRAFLGGFQRVFVDGFALWPEHPSPPAWIPYSSSGSLGAELAAVRF